MAEAGAEVLKVERPGGEDLRTYPPKWGKHSGPFAAMNRGKKSLEIDLRSENALDILRPHIEEADILLEQFRPGVMERLGLSYEAIKKINPSIIYCSITSYGQTGPRAKEAGHDLNFVASAGVLSFSTGPDDAPVLPPYLVGDIGGGTMPAIINILLALRVKDQTGEGTHLDISMADNSFTFAAFLHAAGQATGEYPGNGDWILTGSSPRYQLYPAADGRLIACAAIEQKFWDRFTSIIELEDDLKKDWINPERTKARVAELIKDKPSSHWLPQFETADCCVTLVKQFEEALSDPHFIERGLFEYKVEQSDGSVMGATVVPIVPQFRDSKSKTKPFPELG
jgi:crotonobetainyl-CoA:carnitine CoA-transferase CaiB-like acyl-CoA transferase